MKVHFLYEDKEWENVSRYADAQNIIQDLGLRTLFSISAKEVIYKDGRVDFVDKEDAFLARTMETVMLVPLRSAEEIYYRHEMLADALSNREFVYEMYEVVEEMLQTWDKLGRRLRGRSTKDSTAKLVEDIHVLMLFVNTLSRLKVLLKEKLPELKARGFLDLYDSMCREFSEEKEGVLKKILQDISFYIRDTESEEKTEVRPKIVLGCRLAQGLKCSEFVVEEVTTISKAFGARSSMTELVQGYIRSQRPETVQLRKDMNLLKQGHQLEYEVVRYVVSTCAPFVQSHHDFFDQLHFQLGFYKAASILQQHIERFYLPQCYPAVVSQNELCFDNLKEFVMAIEQRVTPVGNTCDISEKMLLVITGANQGGKSTFLRSIGIAQIMMQCGLPVIADKFESGIFPAFFTHFTRREDAAMNSGRLDEELKRMSQIVDNLGEGSMVLLNESFATTTEKEGSMIAYDIIRALAEADVKILTVTHLLSFAQRIYEETNVMQDIGVEFFCAEREAGGKRTYRMIQHAPELTSFGMDLYSSIIG